jgi:DmsE family decaheme c-type cytochrome
MRGCSKSKAPRFLVVGLIWLFAIAAAVFAQKQPAAAESTSVSGKTAAEGNTGVYAGTEACLHCHKEAGELVSKTVHASTGVAGTSISTGCETCHGPGKAHTDAELEAERTDTKDPEAKKLIFRFDLKVESAKAVNERCLECHASGKDHANFSRSAHSENNLSCLTCHSPHEGMTNQFLLIKAQPELCYTCHLKMKAQFNMPFHHRVEEGLVQCADCHNPHGGFIGKQLRSAAARDTVCFACHVDKQGPFVFEHPVIKAEGCEACHSPHGSPNPRLLKASNLNVLCLRCHTASSFSTASGTPDFHNQAAQYQSCTICHIAIHGSNFDRHFLK